MLICNFCFRECKNKIALASHARQCSNNENRKVSLGMLGKKGSNQYLKADRLGLSRPIVTQEMRDKQSIIQKNTYKNNPEIGNNISKKLKEFFKNNPDKHPWKNNVKFKSVPCEFLKEKLKQKNIPFQAEFQPLQERFFSIDIAFPKIKCGIEVNGNQHYNKDGSLKEYYQNRHRLITDEGWTLIQLHYKLCYNDKYIDEILYKFGLLV